MVRLERGLSPLQANFKELGWHNGESAHLSPMCPRFDFWVHVHYNYASVEFVGSLL